MRAYIVILLLTFSGSASADAYLCIPEAAAGISYNYKNNSNYQSYRFDESQYKFLQTNESGKWVVKILELNVTHFEYCKTEYYCLRNEDSGDDYFLRSNVNQFEALVSSVTNLESGAANKILYMGKCSKI
jgi:hypothetical protein